jgi:hypothetical protein
VTALLEELGLGRHWALLDENEFELDSLQISTAADLVEIGLPPAAAAAIVAHFKPTPDPESEGVPEPEADEPGAEHLVPMEEFDEAAVQRWLGTVLGLTAAQLAAARMHMAEDEYDGPLLAILTAKRLQRLLAGSDAEAAVLPLLAARDAYVAAQSACAAAPGEVRVGSLRFDTEDRVDGGRAATPLALHLAVGCRVIQTPLSVLHSNVLI